MKQKLKQLVEEALENRLNETGNSESTHLLGDCYFNVKALEEVLDKEGVSYTVYCGALKSDYPPNEIPDSFQETKEIGRTHYWIESNGYVCEICSESEKNYGESIVTKERPENYIVFPDSKTETLG